MEDHGEEMFGSENKRSKIRGEKTKELRQAHQRKTEAKGNLSALKGSKENAINVKQKGSAQKETWQFLPR